MINIAWNYRIGCQPVWESSHLIHARKIENKKCEGPSWRAWLTAYGDCFFDLPKSAVFALSNYADVTGKTFQGQAVATYTIQKFYILPTSCLYVLCMSLRIDSKFCPVQN